MKIVIQRIFAASVLFTCLGFSSQVFSGGGSIVTGLSSPSVMEGDAGTTNMTFVLTVDCQIALNMTLDWETADGTATLADNDYNQVNAGAPAPGQLPNVCPTASGAGTTYNLVVAINGDIDFEPDETVQVNLTGASVGAPSFSFNGITNSSGTIQNDDAQGVDIAISITENIDPVIAGSGPDNNVYTTTITNNGPSDATGVVVDGTIDWPAGVTPGACFFGARSPDANGVLREVPDGSGVFDFIGSIGAGASVVINCPQTVGSSAAAGTDVITASASLTAVNETDLEPGNNSDTESTSIGRESDLSITKSDSVDPVVAGTQLTYTIDYANAGPSDSDNVIITDTLPAGTSYVSDTGGCVEAPAGTLTCNVGTVANGGMGQFTITVLVDAGVAVGAGLSNTASIASDDSSDPTPGNSSATEPTGVVREVDIGLSYTESIDPVVAGSGPSNLTHTITYSNSGPSDASGIVVDGSISAPPGVTFVGITGTEGVDVSVSLTDGPAPLITFQTSIPLLSAGNNVPVSFNLTVGSSAPVGTDTIISEASLTSVNEPDTNPGNDAASISTSIERQIDLTVTKTDDPDPVVAGFELGGLEYVVTVTNNGPSDGDGVIINDPQSQFPVGVVLDSWVESAGTYDGTDWTVDLPSGATETLTMTITVGPAAVPGDDAISNTAMVTGSGGGEIIIAPFDDDTVTETTTVLPTTATWTVSKDFLDDSGASITATLTCTSGEVTAPIQVSEGNPGDLTVERFLMGPFGTTTCEVTEALPPDYFQVSASEDCEVDGFVHLDEFDCDFVNAPIRATFEVTKDFSDDNPADVRVVIDCNTGLPLMQEAMVSEFGMPFDMITFIVQDYEVGALNCDVFEEPVPAGYQQDHTASFDPIDALFGSVTDDEDGCYYTEVETGTYGCDITNTLLPVDVTVNKEWIDDRPEFQNPTWVEIFFSCNAPILGDCESSDGTCGADGPGWGVYTHIDPNFPGQFQVLPHWDGSTVCSATEESIPGVIIDQDDCAAIPLAPGMGGECTIVNTRFYEGIPTLSQYGLAVLALLMLGVGLIGFRRFV